MNITISTPKVGLLMIVVTLLVSCCKEDVNPDTTYSISKDNLAWLTESHIGDSFVMQDTNNIGVSFVMQSNETSFTSSSSCTLGITTNSSEREYRNQFFSGSSTNSFSISLSASFPPKGDILRVAVKETVFSIDLDYDELVGVVYRNHYKYKSMLDDSYESEETIYSQLDYIESMLIGTKTYTDILHFTLRDFTTSLDDFSVTEIYLTKYEGLIAYQLHNGLTYQKEETLSKRIGY